MTAVLFVYFGSQWLNPFPRWCMPLMMLNKLGVAKHTISETTINSCDFWWPNPNVCSSHKNTHTMERNKLLMGFDLETVIKVPDTLYDQPDNLTPGFYFGNVPCNNLKWYERTLRDLIFRDPQFQGKYGAVTSKGVLELNQSMCHKFLEEVVLNSSTLGSLLHISTPGPYRGIEYGTTCVQNVAGGNSWNVKVIAGKLCLVSSYNKTSSVVGLLQYSFAITATNKHW